MNFFYRSRLWAFIWLYVLATYLTLPVMRHVLNFIRSWAGNVAVGASMNAALAIGGVAVIIIAIRLGWKTLLQITPPLVILLVAAVQLDIPEERFHFFQYGLLGLLVINTCRQQNLVNLVFAVLFVTLVGLGDELIQWVLPNRVGDPRDVAINTLAGVLGVWIGKYLFWSSSSSRAAS